MTARYLRPLFILSFCAALGCHPLADGDSLAPFRGQVSALLVEGWTTLTPAPFQLHAAVAVTLTNGDVLVAGGRNGATNFPDVRVFHPHSGTWDTLASMNKTRFGHTGTLLFDGRVLMAGGDDGTTMDSAEVYDPALGTWKPTGAMTSPHFDGLARLLPDGRVLVQGGGSGVATDLFDPASGNWTAGPATAGTHAAAAISALLDGTVLVTAGSSANVDRFDPGTNTWGGAQSLGLPIGNATQTVLLDGRVLVIGGQNTAGSNTTNQGRVYTPSLDQWFTASPLAQPREDHFAALLPNGALLIGGGVVVTGGSFTSAPTSAELRDPGTGVFSSAGAMAASHCHAAVRILPGGQIFVASGSTAGGCMNGSSTTTVSEVFDRHNDTWSAFAAPPVALAQAAAVVLADGDVLLAGGDDGGGPVADAWRWSHLSGTWSAVGPPLVARAGGQAVLLADRTVLICGGRTAGGPTATCARFFPDTNAVATAVAMASPRDGLRLVALTDGRAMAIGGDDGTGALATAELFRPASNEWTPASSMSQARTEHVALRLQDGSILVAGGATDVAERYGTDGAWHAAGVMGAHHRSPGAAVMPDGRAVLAGGASSVGAAQIAVDAYDPMANGWTSLASMSTGRIAPSAIVLPNGKLIVRGGTSGGVAVNADSELFDPITRAWAASTSSGQARIEAASLLLPTGGWLWIGGRASIGGAPVGSAEVYDEGRESAALRVPSIDPVTNPVHRAISLGFTGVQLTGSGDSGSGNLNDSTPDFPLLQLFRSEDGSFSYLPVRSWSAGAATLDVPASTPMGSYWLRPVVAGVAGPGIPFQVLDENGPTCNVDAQCTTGFCALDGCCSQACPTGHCATGTCDTPGPPTPPGVNPSGATTPVNSLGPLGLRVGWNCSAAFGESPSDSCFFGVLGLAWAVLLRENRRRGSR